MNNNRGNNNNNRRRGRGNNNRQQGGQQTNRIDSRARGNAPQMLEKYRKLAHDAHLNGDRVTEEYNLQFADHYFRVIADQKQRQEESRQPRRDDRPSDYGDDYGVEYDPYGEAPAPSAQQQGDRAPRQEREPREHREHRGDRGEQRGESRQEPRFEREQRAEPVADEAADAYAGNGTGTEPVAGSVYEPPENPFVRDSRGPGRGLKQRKPRAPRGGDLAEGEAATAPASQGSADAGAEAPQGDFDAATLPPAISARPARKPRAAAPAAPEAEASAETPAGAAGEPAAEEKPRRRRTRKPAADDAGATPEAVNG